MLAAPQATPAPASIPDVYVQAGNSFVITVPNLTRVAVGNPIAVTANVVSPTEVLIQGNPTVSEQLAQAQAMSSLFGNISTVGPQGGVSITPSGTAAPAAPGSVSPFVATSEVFVWSGSKRYVYRVIVVEATGTALPYGVSRMVVEPNKIIFYGLDINRSMTEGDLAKFRALGLKYELRLSTVTPADVSSNFAGLDSRTIASAVRQGQIIPGMSLGDVARSRGPLPAPYSTELRNGVYVDIYRYPDFDIIVYNNTVIEIDRRGVQLRTAADQAYIRTAIDSGIVVPGMTVAEMIEALGAPATAPLVTTASGVIRTEYVYPTVRVIFEATGGNVPLVARVQSNTPAIAPVERPDAIPLGTAYLSGDTLTGRAFELRYLSGGDIIRILEGLNADAKTAGTPIPFSYQTVFSTVEGKFMIYANANTMAFIESLIAYMDRPRAPAAIIIEQTEYTIPGLISSSGVPNPNRQVGFLMARFGASVSQERRDIIVSELRQAISQLPVIPLGIPFSLTTEGSIVTMTGAPEQVTLMRNVLEDMIPVTAGSDLVAAVAEGRPLLGMSKRQVEATLGIRLDTLPLRVFQEGALTTSYDVEDRLLTFREDILVGEALYPVGDVVRNALQEKRLIPYLDKRDVELILGEFPTRVTRLPDGTISVDYNFGTAIYYHDRLLRFNNISGTEAARRSIIMAVPYGSGGEFELLTGEERIAVMHSGNIMTGMTERDISRILSESPFSIRPGTTANEKIYVYTDYEVTFVDGIATVIRQTGAGSPRIIALRSRGAEDIAGLIRASYSDVDNLAVLTDSTSNRLIIRAPNDRFAEIERFAKTMDQQTIAQVLIEAKFVEVSRDAVKQLGIDWGISTQASNGVNRPFGGFGGSSSPEATTAPDARVISGPTGGTSISLPGDAGLLFGIIGANGFNFSGLNYANIDILISALESRGDADILSSPRIMTLNNSRAVLQNQQIRYNVITTTTTSGNPPVTVTGTTYTEVPIGITLDVTPTIGMDGMITMALDAVVTQFVREVTIGTTLLNQIATRTSNSRVMVRSGTPLVIGGLSSRTASRNEQKVPGLGNLPIIGRLFRTERTTATDIELLIFLTARIVPADGTISEVGRVIEKPRPEIPNPAPIITLPRPETASPARP